MTTYNAFLVGVMATALLVGLGALLGASLAVTAASASFISITTGSAHMKEVRP